MNRTIHNGHPPYDSPCQHADAAAAAIRALNHATHDPGNLDHPADVCAIVRDLALLADRLPQTLHQLDTTIRRWHDTGSLTITGGEYARDPATVTHAVNTLLTHRAAGRAVDLAEYLTNTAETLTHATLAPPSTSTYTDAAEEGTGQ